MKKNTRNHIITIFTLIAFVVVAGISLLIVRGLSTSNTVAPNAPQSQPKADSASCQLSFTIPEATPVATPTPLICSTAPSTRFLNSEKNPQETWAASPATVKSSSKIDTTSEKLVQAVAINESTWYGTKLQISGDLQADVEFASVTAAATTGTKSSISLYGRTDDKNAFAIYWDGATSVWPTTTINGNTAQTGRIATITKPSIMTLRAVRTAGTVTFYYNPGDGWVFLDALSYPTANTVSIGVQTEISSFSSSAPSTIALTTTVSAIVITCPSATGLRCDSTCSVDSDCTSGLKCLGVTEGGPSGRQTLRCRNPQCQNDNSCLCVTPTPTASPTPTATPATGCNGVCKTNSDCPISMTCNNGLCRNPLNPEDANCATPKNGGFLIRKYFDTNGNGKPESSEKGLTWKFEWDQNGDGNWKKYDTSDTTNGEGGVVTLPEGTQVRIREIAADGWTATSPTDVTIRIHVGDNQIMQFGNWKGGTVILPTPGPACNSLCTTNTDCPSSMSCDKGICRNPSCTGSSSCLCGKATLAPKSTIAPTEKPQELPKSGAVEDTIKLLGVGIGAVLLGVVGLLAL